MSDATARAQSNEAGSEARFAAAQRRGYHRYHVELDVSLGSEHNFYVGLSENLSMGGVFIATHQLKPVGERLEISIFLPNREEAVRGVGEVRWVREYNERSDMPPGLGLRFVDLDAPSKAAIEQFLKDREPMFYDDED